MPDPSPFAQWYTYHHIINHHQSSSTALIQEAERIEAQFKPTLTD
jgi:hypothetical protein